MTALVAMIAVKVANLVNSHLPNCTVLLVSLQVQERSVDIYLREILFYALFSLSHCSALGCLGIKP